MSRFNKILIPTDFSSASHSATRFAVHLLERESHAAIVFLYNSYEELSDSEKADAQADFAQLTQLFPSETEISYEYVLKTGDLIDNIIQAREESECNLIVMGTKGSHASEQVAKSNTSDLVLRGDCAVIAVPDEYTSFAMRNLALALDHQALEESDQLALLHNIARKYNSAIHVLTIDNDENPIVDEDKHASTLEYYFETLSYQHKFPKNSDIENGINDYVKKHGIDLLAIVPRVHAKHTKPSQGRLLRLLTLRTEVPLLSID
jgi:nucleotide-binding universal stress UspA family protein